VIEAVPSGCRSSSPCSRSSTSHAGPRHPPVEHLVPFDHRDGGGDDARRQGVRVPLLLPASMMRLIEVIEGEDTPRRRWQAAYKLRPSRFRKTPIRCGEAPGFVVNRILNSATFRDLEGGHGRGPRRQGRRQGDPGVRHGADGPFFLTDCWVSTPSCTCGAPARVVRRSLLRDAADEGAGPRPEPRGRRPERASMSTTTDQNEARHARRAARAERSSSRVRARGQHRLR